MISWDDVTIQHKLIIAVIIVILILVIITIYRNKCANTYLEGLWICDEEFCNESDLDGFWIMIGNTEFGLTGSTTTMYIVMYNEDGMLCNRTVDVQLGHSYVGASYINRNLTIVNEDFDIMPTKMTLSVSKDEGHMVLYGRGEGENQDEDTIFGTFYKDNESSHKAKMLREDV